MTEFSPELLRSIEELRNAEQRRAEEKTKAEQQRADQLHANRERIDSLARDAKALGTLALKKGIAPSCTIRSVTRTPKLFRRGGPNVSQTTVLTGWALTAKRSVGAEYESNEGVYIDGLKPSHYENITRTSNFGLITLIGSNCKLYVAEVVNQYNVYETAHTILLTQRPSLTMELADHGGALITGGQLRVLHSGEEDTVLQNIDTDVIATGLAKFAENHHLYR